MKHHTYAFNLGRAIATLASLAAGCELELEGSPCPCPAELVCCETDQRCYPESRPCGMEPPVVIEPEPSRFPRHCNVRGFCGARNPLLSVWGSSDDDIWVISEDTDHTILDDSPPIESDAGLSPDTPREIADVPETTSFEHWDGERWWNTPHRLLTDYYDFAAVGGSSANDVWFVGTDGQTGLATHWDGENWSEVMWLDGGRALQAVWAHSPDDAWAVGTHAAHWDGEAWTTLPMTLAAPLYDVWGSASNDVWAVGGRGMLLHWDGGAFQPVSDVLPTDIGVMAVWGSAANDVWMVGERSTVLHFDGERFTRVDLGSLEGNFVEVAGAPGHGVWIADVDGRILHGDLNGFAETELRFRQAPSDLWVSPTGKVWVVGGRGESAWFDGARWQASPEPRTRNLFAVWGSSATDVWAVGESGEALHYQGATWARVPTGVTFDLSAVHGSAADDVWSAGEQILHWDGQRWSKSHDAGGNLNALWAVRRDLAYAVGDQGLVLHWDGREWRERARFPELTLTGVWGDADTAWATDEAHHLLRWDGSRWDQYLAGGVALTDEPTWQVLTASGAGDMWLLRGYDNAQGHWQLTQLWDGSGVFQQREAALWRVARAAFSDARRDFWLVGDAIWRFNGGTGKVFYNGLDMPLFGVWAAPAAPRAGDEGSDDVWAVGAGGLILHREPVKEAGYALGPETLPADDP